MNRTPSILELLQYIIIITFLILSNQSSNEKLLDKNSEYYNFLKRISIYNTVTKIFVTKKNIEFQEQFGFLLENNEYFYIFNNNIIYAYFFKEKNSDEHIIYFNGITNITDLKIVIELIHDILNNNFNNEKIKSLLNNVGNLYKINSNSIELNNNNFNIFDLFEYLYKNIYFVENKNKIRLKINGFSLGGPISQIFAKILTDEYINLDIQMYNIESWFGGNKELYKELNDKIKIFNIYNKNSSFYFFNKYFQKYFKTNLIIKKKDEEIKNYMEYIFPIGVIKYISDNHLLSKFLE